MPRVGYVKGAEFTEQDVLNPKIDLNNKYYFKYNEPMFWQMWLMNWTLKEYLAFLDQPKTLINPIRGIRLFHNEFLE